MKRDVLLLGFLVGAGIFAGSLTSRTIRTHVSALPGRLMGRMMEHMPDE